MLIRPVLAVLAIVTAMPVIAAERRFDASGFDRVALGGSDDVIVRGGPQFAVVANGEAADLDRLEIKVEKTTLNIGRKPGGWLSKGKDVTVTVTLPTLRAVAAVDARTVNVGISGSGDVRAAGRCGALNVRVAGSGDADLAGLRCTNASVAVAGSGDVKADVARAAEVRVAGSGDVAITGGARCTKKVAGSGTVTCS